MNKKFIFPNKKTLMNQVARVKTPNKLAMYIAGICGIGIIAAFGFSGMSNAVVQDDDNALTNKLKPTLDLKINDEDIKPKSFALNNNQNDNIKNKLNNDDEVQNILAKERQERENLQKNNLYENNIYDNKEAERYKASSYIAVNNNQINKNNNSNNQDTNNIQNINNIPNMENTKNIMQMMQNAQNTDNPNINNNDANMQKSKQAFTTKSGNFGYLDSTLQHALSDKEIKAGTVIPAILMHSLNSDLPGMVIATVSQDVYDSISHTNIIIPKGTKLNGIYDSNLSFGQDGLAVVWNRLVFTDGSTFDLGSMTGTDQSGNSGFRDKVNNHYARTFGSSILVAIIGSGMQLSQPKGRTNTGNDAQETITANIAQQTGNTAQNVLNKTLNVQPTVTIKSGYRFNVMVNKDFVID